MTAQNPSRRHVTTALAWGAPALAVAVSAPARAASVPGAPATIQVATPITRWSDRIRYSGFIAQGVVVTIRDANGLPVPNQPVTLTIPNYRGNENTFYFVSNRAVSSDRALDTTRPFSSGVGATITLTTDANGQVALDDGTTGYLRKGSDGTDQGTTFIVTSGDASTTFVLTNSTQAGGTEPGIKVA
ncbi:hypothetical protein M3C00_007870 [Micrococcus luteus]|uniref:Uncharacterized protein n=1 Tax=Micrococcus luteus TaxID=1270 RepID=A0AAP3EU56_MICLU|nr:hypothetical protein [Micrococcus luteus]MCV7588331.1 hypothetical protein [Micrococcus luteus]MCV7628943.1 hypothetical protein [Micrococcus luteus]MCV7734569.1 hypothetical protein [Micrococcus luteus]